MFRVLWTSCPTLRHRALYATVMAPTRHQSTVQPTILLSAIDLDDQL